MNNVRVNPISRSNQIQKYPYPKYMDRVQESKKEESFREQLKQKMQNEDEQAKKDKYRKTHDTIEITHNER